MSESSINHTMSRSVHGSKQWIFLFEHFAIGNNLNSHSWTLECFLDVFGHPRRCHSLWITTTNITSNKSGFKFICSNIVWLRLIWFQKITVHFPVHKPKRLAYWFGQSPFHRCQAHYTLSPSQARLRDIVAEHRVLGKLQEWRPK